MTAAVEVQHMIFNAKKKAKETTDTTASTPAPAKKNPDQERSGRTQSAGRSSGDERRGARPTFDEFQQASKGRPGPRTERGVPSSVLNEHLSFEGSLKYSGTVTIDCDFRGNVTTEDKLTIGPGANVNAEISAGVVEIAGKVHGNVTAKTSVNVLAGAEVHGDIETPTISMEQGVVFEGRCTRPPSPPEEDTAGSREADTTDSTVAAVVSSGFARLTEPTT